MRQREVGQVGEEEGADTAVVDASNEESVERRVRSVCVDEGRPREASEPVPADDCKGRACGRNGRDCEGTGQQDGAQGAVDSLGLRWLSWGCCESESRCSGWEKSGSRRRQAEKKDVGQRALM